jgi:hypothetical protein
LQVIASPFLLSLTHDNTYRTHCFYHGCEDSQFLPLDLSNLSSVGVLCSGVRRFEFTSAPFGQQEEGARTTLHCALHAPQSETGLCYSDSQSISPAPLGQDDEIARALSERSEAWVR